MRVCAAGMLSVLVLPVWSRVLRGNWEYILILTEGFGSSSMKSHQTIALTKAGVAHTCLYCAHSTVIGQALSYSRPRMV